MKPLRIGFAICGSFCTFKTAIDTMQKLVADGHTVTPIFSYHASALDTRFGKAADFLQIFESVSGRKAILTIPEAEPIGPAHMFDVLLVAPCTGNTLAKLAYSIIDTPVTMAVKSHLRNGRPAVLAIATNDALSGCAKNIGMLMNYRNYYFVPLAQDDSEKKSTSMVANFEMVPAAIEAALEGRQIQPVFDME